jgi:hypothetical protein
MRACPCAWVTAWVGAIFRYKATDTSSAAKCPASRSSVVVVSGQESSLLTSLFFSSYCSSSSNVTTRPNPFPWTWHSGIPKGHNTYTAHVCMSPTGPLQTSLFLLTIATPRKSDKLSGDQGCGPPGWIFYSVEFLLKFHKILARNFII